MEGPPAPRKTSVDSRIRSRLALSLLLALGSVAGGHAAPVLSEILAINDAGLLDGDGDTEDWIELCNPDAAPFDMEGYYLTDDPDDLTRWPFPAGSVIGAGAYLIVFASGKTDPPVDELHAGWKLASGGEFLALVAPDGQTIVDSYAPEYPQQYGDISYGLAGDGLLKYFTAPTPGAPNVGGISDPQGLVQFTPPSKTLTATTLVELSSANPAAAIRYTIDGSDPDESSALYAGPLAVNLTTEVRARVYLPGEPPGPVNSASYVKLRGNDVKGFTSPLPIVLIENFGAGPIPDKRAHNPPAGNGGGIQQVPRQPAFLAIFDRGADGVARLADPPDLTTRMGIRVRGSSSAAQPAKKENCSMEAWSATNEDQVDIRPLGLPADNDFLLYAPYHYDRALIRNAWVYESMQLMGHYAPRTRFVEVFINTEGDPLTMSDFAGVFVLLEKVKQSRDRVDIDDFSPDGATGGWLLESNRMDPLPEDSSTQPFNFHTAGPNRIKETPSGGGSGGGDDIPTGYNTFLNFVEPNGYETTRAQRRSIIAWFDTFEDSLYGADFRRPDTGYRRYLDLDSFIDHWIMVNLCRNVDGLQLSTFMYRPSTDGKLHLNPVWDYDRAIDSYDGRDDAVSGMWAQQFLWFPRLFSDPEFAQRAADRWQELRRGVLSTASMHARIDAMAAEITESVAAANFNRWPSSNTPRGGGWPAEIAHMKSWLAARAAWLDDQYLAPPELSPPGGSSAGSVLLSMQAGTRAAIYYTLDETDPRLPDLPGFDLELLAEAVPARGFVPTPANGGPQLGTAWKGGQEPFDDSAWMAGDTGLGFGYPDLAGIDASAMLGVSGSAYLRVPFTVDAAALESLVGLTLNMKYEDGFVAWINGVEVASSNRPAALAWDSTATAVRTDLSAVEFAPFDISAHLDALQPGDNLLAIQVLNSPIDSANVLAMPQLLGRTAATEGPSPTARRYSGPLQLDTSATVTARHFQNGVWSGPVTASYVIGTPADASNLALTELNFHPQGPSPSEISADPTYRDDDFEFLELKNISGTEIDLGGARFVDGIEFTFPIPTVLEPGGYLLIVENAAAFEERYGPGLPVAGVYANKLNNDGEALRLVDLDGGDIFHFIFNDLWHPATDGPGHSLVAADEAGLPGDYGNPASWRPSSAISGSPGRIDGITTFASWLSSKFTASELADPAITGPDVDLNGNGFGTFMSYALGLNLHSAEPSNYPTSQFVSDGGKQYLSYTFRRRMDAPYLDYQVLVSGDLYQWSETTVVFGEIVDNGDGTETITIRDTVAVGESGLRFMRLEVEQLPDGITTYAQWLASQFTPA
jgi:hypothetical protein